MKKEVRNIQIPVTVEERKDGALGSIYGYPIVYNSDSEDMGFIERIAPGAAKKALKKSDIRGLKNHDPSLIFARQGVNLKFTEDKDGLRYEATPVDTRNFREIADEVRVGLLTGQSFGFTVAADEWEGLDTDKPTRTITEIDTIYDVGPVTYPAYQDTSVALRSLEEAQHLYKYSPRAHNDLEVARDSGTQTTQNDSTTLTFTYIPSLVVNGMEVDCSNTEELDQAIETIQSLRSELSPMTNDLDSTEDEPMLDKSLDTTKNLFDKMEQMEKKHSEV